MARLVRPSTTPAPQLLLVVGDPGILDQVHRPGRVMRSTSHREDLRPRLTRLLAEVRTHFSSDRRICNWFSRPH